MHFHTFLLLLGLWTISLSAQEKKAVAALRISSPVEIDGVLNEPFYALAQPAKDFVQLQPYNGKPSYQSSEVRILFDHNAIYVGAMLYDSAPDSIYNFFSGRDNIGMSDYFGIYFDPYNQGQVAYGFFITPVGVQTDLKASKGEYDQEDSNWDAVWQSKTRITKDGWVVELRIPYSALRFSENSDGVWGLNMFRNIRRYNSNNSWNFIDRKIDGFIHQEGSLLGIQNIKPPVRLSISPYAAAYVEYDESRSSADFIYKGGVDLKYGLSESFTLDMMLVPDFGQVQSDDRKLNITPYELFYEERRQFFTEGTELFAKGGIFYSRRIGGRPVFSEHASEVLRENEEVKFSPSETQLLNATKISGRTTNGWGLGMLNAVSLEAKAVLQDTITGANRDVTVQPLTNYNVCVVDKTLPNNSYISFINSNVLMAKDTALFGHAMRANVTATDFQIRNKKKNFAVKGKGALSLRPDHEKEGFYAELGAEKTSGQWYYGLSQSAYSDRYNPNDLGYLRRNDELISNAYAGFRVIEPFSIFREMNTFVSYKHSRRFHHALFSANEIEWYGYTQFKNNYGIEASIAYNGDTYNYYEPRTRDRYFFDPHNLMAVVYLFSDNRKPLRIGGGMGGYTVPDTRQHAMWGNLYTRLRMGRRFMLEYELQIEDEYDDRGYADADDEGNIYFAIRNAKTKQQLLNVSYTLNNKADIQLRLRHYWSGIDNKSFYRLQSDGTLIPDFDYTQANENYNSFNVDMVFRWIFAPGSELSIAWKNSILDLRDEVTPGYFNNFSQTWQSDQINTFSVRLLYYFDFNRLRKKT
jgi:hypothetical protein